MPIETILTLAAACVRALEFAARLERQSREVKAKCQELAERVKILQEILPRYSSAAAKDSGTKAMLGRLEDALDAACRAAESCDRHVQSGVVGAFLSAVSDFSGECLTKLKAAEEKINTCIGDLGFAVRAPGATLVVSHYNNTTNNIFRADRINVNVAVQQPGAASSSSSSSSSRRTYPQMLGSSPGPVVSGVPSSSHHQRRPTAPTTTTTTHVAAASSSSASRHRPSDHRGAPGPATTITPVAAAIAAALAISSRSRPTDRRGAPEPATRTTHPTAAAAASRSRPMTDHRGAPGPATRTTRAPPPVPPPQPVVRRSSTSSSRARRPPTEPRGAPRGLGGGGLPQQHATAARPARSTTAMPRHPPC